MASGEPGHAALHVTIAVVFAVWAGRLRQPFTGPAESPDVREQLEQQAAALASQAAQLAELQERVDFAERLLVQIRERPALGPREGPG